MADVFDDCPLIVIVDVFETAVLCGSDVKVTVVVKVCWVED